MPRFTKVQFARDDFSQLRFTQVTRYKNRNITGYRERGYERHTVSVREWKKIFREARAGRVPGGIVPKLLTAGGQPCYRWHVLAIGRPTGKRERWRQVVGGPEIPVAELRPLY